MLVFSFKINQMDNVVYCLVRRIAGQPCIVFLIIQTQINTSLCKMKFWIINITISNLDELRELILNNKTMMNVINLFQNTISRRHNPLIITLKDLLSSTNHVELTIDKQWLENLFEHYQRLPLSWSLSFNAHNWSQVNLTIHRNAMIYMTMHHIRLYLRQTGLDKTCTVVVFEGTSIDQQWCKHYITLINDRMYMISSLRIFFNKKLLISSFHRRKVYTLATNTNYTIDVHIISE